MKKNNNLIIWIILIVIIILVLLFPKIYGYIESFDLPDINGIEENNKEENKVVDNETLESIHRPLMRNSIYNEYTYYKLDKFTINDMSNSDILLNAYLDIYEGNMTSFEYTGNCTNVSKQFGVDYIELRIKNILGKNIKYNLENFYVPEDSGTNYKGNWRYDIYNSRFIYDGICASNVSNITYHNLEQLIKAEYNKKDIIVYYYVGFAKVEGNNYTIYKDSNMTEVVDSGTLSNANELNSIFSNIDNKDKKIYKYTFKNNLCSYNEYCLFEGMWVNEF